MILYITPEQQSKHYILSQASWASSKNRVRPDTNIYPTPTKCPPASLAVPLCSLICYKYWSVKLWCMHFLYLSFTLFFLKVVFIFLFYSMNLWVVLKFHRLCLLVSAKHCMWDKGLGFFFSTHVLCQYWIKLWVLLRELLWSRTSQLLVLTLF